MSKDIRFSRQSSIFSAAFQAKIVGSKIGIYGMDAVGAEIGNLVHLL